MIETFPGSGWLLVAIIVMGVAAFATMIHEENVKERKVWRELVNLYGEEQLRGLSLMDIHFALQFGLLRPLPRESADAQP